MSDGKSDEGASTRRTASRYRKVEVRTWGDEKFRALSPIPPCGQGLWLFLITGPHTCPIPGLFRAGRAAMAEELGWELEAFDEAFGEAFREGMAKADFKARVVWVPKAIKHNRPESPNVVRSWASEFDLIPECDLKREAYESLKASIHALGEAFGKAFDESFVKPSGKPSEKAMANQEQEQEQEEIQHPPPPQVGVGRSAKDAKANRRSVGSPGFEAFWSEWPRHKRKAAKPQCRALWHSKGCEAIADRVIAAVRAMKASDDWRKDGGQFIPAPLVWLRQERWEAVQGAVSAMVPAWVTAAGFGNRDEAEAAGCTSRNAEQFRDGERIVAAELVRNGSGAPLFGMEAA